MTSGWVDGRALAKMDDSDRRILESYKRLEFRVVSGGSTAAERQERKAAKPMTAQGDHITVAYLGGSLPLYIRVGSDDNPYIRLREGMVIRRPFRELLVVAGSPPEQNLSMGLHSGHVVLYTSFGPLLELPPKEYGLRRAPFTCQATLVAGLNNLLSTISSALDGDYLATVGRHGGTLLIKNIDSINTFEIVGIVRSLASSPRGMPIGPGESIPLQLEDVALAGISGAPVNALTEGLGFYVVAGTCKIALLLTTDEVDWGAPEQATSAFPQVR